jgi:hypothetical protein
MNADNLDTSYTALCKALGEVGQDNASLFLAMVSLSLMSQSNAPDAVLKMIAEARSHCLPDTAN